MNENVKTLVFVGAAVLLSAAGYVASNTLRSRQDNVNAGIGALFPDFKDPLAAARLKISDVDEVTGTPESFEVANSKGIWSIPSHEDYPADAAKQLEEAAASLIDLSTSSYVSDRKSDHAIYGVLNPDEQHESGVTGVGKRVTMEDATGVPLCDFIIGKAEPDQPDIRYVRLPSQDRIYRVKINVDKLSTKFADWIEKDLLKIDTFDMRRILLDHYTAQLTQRGVKLDQGEKIRLDYNDKDSKWALASLIPGDASPEEKEEPLATGEELLTDKVNDLKNSIDQIKIVDVHRKPKGLGRDLRAELGPGERDQEAFASLVPRGFYPLSDGPMLGAAGEAQIGNANGVRYVLRFGGLDTSSQGKKAAEEKPVEGEEAVPQDDGGANRFLLVMAEFDPSFIPKPELKVKQLPPLEELLQADPPAEEKPTGETPKKNAAGKPGKDADKPAKDGDKPTKTKESGKPAASGPKLKAPGTNDSGEKPENADKPAEPDDPAEDALPEEAASEDQSSCTAPAATDIAATLFQETPADKKQEPADKPAAEDKPAEDKPADEAKPADGDKPATDDAAKQAEEEARKKAAAELLRNEQDDDRKIADYKRKVRAGRDRVKELNDRFADWYYVISDSMYHKILLDRAELVKTAEPEKEPADESGDDAPGEDTPGEDAPADDAPADDAAAPDKAPVKPEAAPAKPTTPAPAKPAAPPAAKPAAPPAKPK
ncbi:MAG: DUF4340 domain-containing protein [Pirellulales bacterium]